jgi:chaperonin GroES
MNFKPMGARVLVLPDPEKKETEAGTILIVADKVVTGEVVAVGPGSKSELMELKVGDRISYMRNAGTPVKLVDVDYLLMKQGAIYGVL